MPPQRRRKACRECRAHKIKCSAEPPEICARCQRLGLACVLNSDVSSRLSKAQLQRELDALKGQGAQAAQASEDSILEPAHTSHSDRINLDVSSISNSSPGFIHSAVDARLADYPCLPRTIDEKAVTGDSVKDCFQRFFQNHGAVLPILDPLKHPDSYYDTCQFLFWVIVCVGSRRYADDPSILEFLGPRMNRMALLALESGKSPIETLQGIIFLVHWPAPTNSMFKDMSHILSGAALHLAMQIGLHVVGNGQDFARTALPSDTDHSSRAYRAQIFVHCLIAYHSTSLRIGMLPLVLMDSPLANPSNTDLPAQFPDGLKTQWAMIKIAMAAIGSLVRITPLMGSITQVDLSPIISLYDAQLLEMMPSIKSPLDMVYLHCYRIHLLAYHFLEYPKPNHEGLIKLYMVACRLLDCMIADDDSTGLAKACSDFINKTTLLAAISILKIQKSELVRHVNSIAGEKAYFSGIFLCQRMSLQSNDLGSRGVTILGQMWTSQNIYRRPDGRIDSLGTKIRSRLSMSVVFDSFWWWREEFGGQKSPYIDRNQGLDTTPRSNPSQDLSTSLQTQTDSFPIDSELDMLLMNEPFPDYDWAASLDFPAQSWQEPSVLP